MIRHIFEGIFNPDWHERIDKQLKDDAGGYGEQNSIAIFGKPGSGKFEFVMTGRHMTIRCDGNSAEHVAFGGPIFYGHAASGFNEKPTIPATSSGRRPRRPTSSTRCSTASSSEQALVRRGPAGERSRFRGKDGQFPGLPVSEMSKDQKEHLQDVLQCCSSRIARATATRWPSASRSKAASTSAVWPSTQNDLGDDGVWDIWRLEGPSFVWYFRGAPHVHVWVNVADDPNVKLNA